MYYPYFRGKQNELIAIRESSPIFAAQNFIPIIEPVKEELGGLKKALDAICESDAKAIVIINPQFGDHKSDGKEIYSLLRDGFNNSSNIVKGVLLTEKTIC